MGQRPNPLAEHCGRLAKPLRDSQETQDASRVPPENVVDETASAAHNKVRPTDSPQPRRFPARINAAIEGALPSSGKLHIAATSLLTRLER